MECRFIEVYLNDRGWYFLHLVISQTGVLLLPADSNHEYCPSALPG
jgi:hypothetical protein